MSDKPADVAELDWSVYIVQNKLRTEPASFIPYLEEMLTYFDGKILKVPGKIQITTAEGAPAVEEAIEYLKNAEPLNALSWNDGLSKSCQDHVADQAPTGQTGHFGSDGSDPFDRMLRHGEWDITASENLAYGSNTGTEIIMSLFVDDDVPDRGHRVTLFNDRLNVAGVYSGPHKVYRDMTCINYAGEFEEDESSQPKEVPDPSEWASGTLTTTKPDDVSVLDW